MNLNLPFSWVGTKEKHVLTLKQLQLRATPFHHPIKGYQVIKQLQSIERKHRKNRSAINLSMDMITKHHPTFFGLLPSTSRMSRYLIYTLRYPIRSELQTKTNGAKGVKNSPKEMVTWASQTLWKRGRSNGCGFVVASASNQIHEFMNRKITIGNAPPRTILLYAMGDIMGW